MASIETTKEMNKLLAQQSKLYEVQARVMKSQLFAMRQLVEVLRGANVEELTKGMEQFDKAVDEAAQSVDQFSQSKQVMDALGDSLEAGGKKAGTMSKGLDGMAKKLQKIAVGALALKGLKQGFDLTASAISSVVSLAGSLVGSLFNLGAAILSIPFKIIGALMNQSGGGGGGLREQIEKTREEFGSLATGEGRAIMDAFRGIRKIGGELAETGLSIRTTMGNVAEVLEKVREIAKGMGPVFHSFQEELVVGVERIFAYRKGLGLTEEGFRAFAERAHMGQISVQELGRQMTSASIEMGRRFGMSAKLISRDMGEMMNEFSTFGRLGTQNLANVAVFARKLGVEVKTLGGIVDNFLNFEDAATNAAKLSQAFGIQVDALQMMREQDPAAQIENLRKAFHATGRSVESMNRAELKLLSSLTTQDEKTTAMVFSQKNRALSYDQIKRQGAAAEKQQLSQAEAMKALADQIERLVKGGGGQLHGFLDMFIMGFMRGIRMSREFRELFVNIRSALKATFLAGRELGGFFVKEFPGVVNIFKGFADLFNKARWKTMLKGVVASFRQFFDDLTKDPRTAFSSLLENLKTNFLDWFNASEPAAQKVLEGFKSFFKALAQIGAGMLREGMRGLVQIIRFIAELIRNPQTAMGSLAGPADGLMGFVLNDVLRPLWEAITEQWPFLVAAFSDLVDAAWTRLSPILSRLWSDHWGKIVAVLFGPALLGAGLRAAVGGMGVFLGNVLARSVADPATQGGITRAISSLGAAFGRAGQVATPGDVEKGGDVTDAVTKSIDPVSKANKAAAGSGITAASIGRFAVIALVITLGMVAVIAALALLAERIQEKNLSVTSIVSAGIMMVTAGAVMLELAGTVVLLGVASKMMQKFGPQIAIGMTILGVTAAAMAAGMYAIVLAFQDVRDSDITKTVKVMAAGSMFMLAAIGIAFGATMIGALTMATKGLAAAVMAAGIVALADVIIKIAEETQRIFDVVGRLQITADIGPKLDLFLKILDGISRFVSAFTPMMSVMIPDLSELAATGESFGERMRMAGDFMRQVQEDIRNTVDQFLKMAEKMPQPSEIGRQITAITDIMTATAAMIEAVKPPDEFNDSSWWEDMTGRGVGERLAAYRGVMSTVLGQLQQTVRTVMRELSNLVSGENFTEGTAEMATGIGAILAAVAAVGRSMTSFFTSGGRDVDPDKLKALAPALSATIDAVMRAVVGTGDGPNVFSRIGELFDTLLGSIGDINPAEAKKLATATPLINGIFTAISGLSVLIGNLSIPEAGSSIRDKVTAIKALVDGLLEGFGEHLGTLITSLAASFSNLNSGQISGIQAGVGALTPFFGTVDNLVGLVKTMTEIDTGGSEGKVLSVGKKISEAMKGMMDFISGTGEGSLTSFVTEMPTAMSAFSSAMEAVAANAPTFVGSTEALNNVLKGFENVFGPTALKYVEGVEQQSVRKVQQKVQAMLDHINDIGNTLGRMNNINLEAKLQAVNNQLQLAGGNRLTINKRPVTMHFNFNVKMDAESVASSVVKTDSFLKAVVST
jgi:hypothetical protein